VPVALVAAFVAAFFALGAVSKSSPASSLAVSPGGAGQVPFEAWYWTMIVAPSDPNVLLLATNSGILRSADGGKTWKAAGLKTVNTTSLAQVGKSVYAAGVTGPNPVARKGGGRTAPDGHGVFAASTDEGKTWRTLHPGGLPATTVQALAVDPASSDTAVYALMNDGKLYRSADGARSFQLLSAKVGISPWALAVTGGGQFVGGDMDSGGFRSANGKAWLRTPFKDGRGGRMVMEYAVNPGDANKVLMSSVGIEQSTDGGKTWHTALKSSVMFGPIAFAPSQSEVAYAVGFDRSLWRSEDGGATWKQLS
jgi:photosystem II stability/assembly factor-like uncharacterized protein